MENLITYWERANELMLTMNEAREYKICLVRDQDYEKAAYHRDKERTAALELNEMGLLTDELKSKHSIFTKMLE